MTYKRNKIRLPSVFLTETFFLLKESRITDQCREKCEPKILCSVKLTFMYKGHRSTIMNMQGLREYYSRDPFLRNVLENRLQTMKTVRESSLWRLVESRKLSYGRIKTKWVLKGKCLVCNACVPMQWVQCDSYSKNYKSGGERREHMQNFITFLGNYIDSGSISIL